MEMELKFELAIMLLNHVKHGQLAVSHSHRRLQKIMHNALLGDVWVWRGHGAWQDSQLAAISI